MAAWWKGAVLYHVYIRSFYDSDGDGHGDLPGVLAKLDYIHSLGVDGIWLSPIHPSPNRDWGYDIADFSGVQADYGTVDDVQALLDAAHARGLKVVLDEVLSHTSDEHPWFIDSLTGGQDGPKADWYVWADPKDDGTAPNNWLSVFGGPAWAYQPARRQHYHHKFLRQQPKLNWRSAGAREAALGVLDFWLERGVDGFRLDAVPYLYEEEGTNGENLARTHQFLKKVRAHVDANYPGRVLLAEANQWPADVVDYFGDPAVGGDECHMCFHFPVMPRIFMAVRRESRYPISEIMEQTPAIPEHAQWGIFLRNHDELTLEMVTDDDRDYMWNEYATDPRMKANIGIRRRLAPLLDNDTNQMELFTALLLSLPGSPVLYYGDEIGMGDNIWLGDRDGVRTPMQWTPDRNAGFSSATPGRLALPVIMDPVFGFQAINVEAQQASSSSLLQWTRRMIYVRKQHSAFGRGSFLDLGGSNPSVLSYLREDGDDVMLCVNNLSRFPQPVELDLHQFSGRRPVEMLGGVEFPSIGELPYLLTLAGYGFYWFRIVGAAAEGAIE